MAKNKLQIIITGESGKCGSLFLRKKTLRNSVVGLILLTALLAFGSFRGLHYSHQNRQLEEETARLAAQLRDSRESATEAFQNRQGLAERFQYTRVQLNQQLAEARNELARVVREKEALISSYQQQIADLKQNQETILEGTISRLDERARVIETVIHQLGVKVEEDPDHSGGPYISLDGYGDKLICDTDRYLNTLQYMPLGAPVDTGISSGFGKRKDPLNKKRAYHTGIDFKGKTGDNIRSTGDGVVKKSAYNSGLGHHLILSHGNGYETVFGHLSKRLVKKGDRVSRGQVIGLVGNTGRSTGSHLHYEVRLHGKAINPTKYLQVAELSVSSAKEN